MNCLNLLMSLVISMPIAIDITSERIGNVFTEDESVIFHTNSNIEFTINVTNYHDKNVLTKKILCRAIRY